ncbi:MULTISPECIES: DUF305 domain-containing protein [unclassified Mycobacterium]|uniref:DUF305 domain-containing protein n=1 Tax=unclassified Mycobacterium TaxID=2642494 RepID=UPI0029C76A76|nr:MULTISPECIES: DUF305 domain-containing protein [unclassified Mycobacterium]
MHNTQRVGIAAAAAAALITISACSNGDTQAQTSTGTPVVSSSTAPAAESHNDADVAFAQGMIPHHQQAIEMSDMLLGKQGVDPRVITLANEIKAAQGPEIDQMTSWLSQWGAATTTSSSPSSTMPGMPGHDMSGGDMSGMAGHGMMSDQDMAALQEAQGAEASRLFLTQMIQHHEGAITMAKEEIDIGQFPAAVTMARSIVTSQQQEITTMKAMLDSL